MQQKKEMMCFIYLILVYLLSIASYQLSAQDPGVVPSCNSENSSSRILNVYNQPDIDFYENPGVMAWSPDSQYLAVWLNRLRKPDVPDPTPMGFVWIPEPVRSYLQIWHVPSGQLQYELQIADDDVSDFTSSTRIVWRDDSKALLLSVWSTIRLWTGGETWARQFYTEDLSTVSQLFWSSDNTQFVTAQFSLLHPRKVPLSINVWQMPMRTGMWPAANCSRCHNTMISFFLCHMMTAFWSQHIRMVLLT